MYRRLFDENIRVRVQRIEGDEVIQQLGSGCARPRCLETHYFDASSLVAYVDLAQTW